MNDNNQLAMDAYAALLSSGMFIGRNYFSDGVSWVFMRNRADNSVSVQRLTDSTRGFDSVEINFNDDTEANVALLRDTVMGLSASQLQAPDGWQPEIDNSELINLSATMFVDLMGGVVQKQYDYTESPILLQVHAEDNTVSVKKMADAGAVTINRVKRPSDQPSMLQALIDLFNSGDLQF